ncbi:MAG: histidine kinase [Aeromicrobium erythreum]
MLALSFPVEGTFVGLAFDADGPLVIPDVSRHPTYGFDEQVDFGPVLFVPVVVGGAPAGLLAVCRRLGRPTFTARDITTVEAFALHLGLAHERLESRESRRRVTLMEDRERIAQDLHDHVIQRLFATGMNLQVAVGRADESLRQVLDRQIEEIDDAIVQIRQSIFAIRGAGRPAAPSLRARILEIIERVEDHPQVRPTVTFMGPVDLLVDGELTDDVVAVSTEAVTNALRHAAADHVELTVSAVGGQVTVEVQDDGRGMAADLDGHGLGNLRRRAENRGGRLEVAHNVPTGTRLLWSAPTP